MGMSTYVIGFVSPEDETYKNHSNVLIACVEAGVSELPKETADYFGSKYPEMYLLEDRLEIKIPYGGYTNDYQTGYEVLVPEGVHKIRFLNDWN